MSTAYLGGLGSALTGGGDYRYLTSNAITISTSGSNTAATNISWIGLDDDEPTPKAVTPTPSPAGDSSVAWLRQRVEELCWHA